MIKKIIILALAVVGLYFFYKYFVASTMDPFFKQKVDLLGTKAPEVK